MTALVALLVSCSSGGGDATPTFQAPPPKPEITPMATGTVSQATIIDGDNAQSLKVVSTGKLEQPYGAMAWRSDGQAIFVASRQAIYVLQATADTLTSVLAVPEPAFVLAVSSDGKAAVANDPHTISIVDTGPDTVLKTLTIDGTLTAAHFSPDGKVLAVTLADSITTQIWDVAQGLKAEDLSGFETAAPVYSVKFGPAGRSLIWYSRPKAQVIDLVTAQLGPSVMEADFISAIALSPAEKVLATAAGISLTLWDLENADVLDVYDLPGAATDMAYTPDGKLLFIATNSGITGLELPLLTPAGEIPGAVQAIAVAPAGDGLASVSRDGVVSMYRPK